MVRVPANPGRQASSASAWFGALRPATLPLWMRWTKREEQRRCYFWHGLFRVAELAGEIGRPGARQMLPCPGECPAPGQPTHCQPTLNPLVRQKGKSRAARPAAPRGANLHGDWRLGGHACPCLVLCRSSPPPSYEPLPSGKMPLRVLQLLLSLWTAALFCNIFPLSEGRRQAWAVCLWPVCLHSAENLGDHSGNLGPDISTIYRTNTGSSKPIPIADHRRDDGSFPAPFVPTVNEATRQARWRVSINPKNSAGVSYQTH